MIENLANCDYHVQRREESRRRRVAFAHAYVSLLRARRAKGKSVQGVKVMAAAMVGLGS